MSHCDEATVPPSYRGAGCHLAATLTLDCSAEAPPSADAAPGPIPGPEPDRPEYRCCQRGNCIRPDEI